jgi:HPt (histidine-containing phosphotransfer) domain-containing protein
MAPPRKPSNLTVETFADHQVIQQPNPLRNVIRRVDENDVDDPVGRAEQALADLSTEFTGWMKSECDRLVDAHAAIVRDGLTASNREEFFRAAHDIKGDAATFGYPIAAAAAESLCRIIEHAPDLEKVPDSLIAHHVNAVSAIIRDHGRLEKLGLASEVSKQLRSLADTYLAAANQDRPEHLEAILSPRLAPDI